MAKKVAELAQLKLRITDKLRRDLEREAKKNHRSANAEAVERLEKSLSANPVGNWDAFFEMLVGGGEKADLLRSLAFKMQNDEKLVEDIKSELLD